MDIKRRKPAARLIANTLQTLAVLGIVLVTIAACGGKKVVCTQYVVSLCGRNGVQVTACGMSESDALSRDEISLYLENPPDYLDVPPIYGTPDSEHHSGGLLQFPAGLTLDPSFQPATSSVQASFAPTITPENYGSQTIEYNVGTVTWSDGGGSGQGNGVAVDHEQRVFVTSAHQLLGSKEDAGTDISQRVFTVHDGIIPGNSSYPQWTGWGFVHPMYDPKTRAYDVGFVVVGESFPGKIGSLNRQHYSLGGGQNIQDRPQHCTCPLEGYSGQLTSYGDGNTNRQVVCQIDDHGNTTPKGCVSPPNPFKDGSFSFPSGFGAIERISSGQVFEFDGLELEDLSRAPTIDLFTNTLFSGDKGTPMWSSYSDSTPYSSMTPHSLWAVYSGPSTVQTRRFTRLTSATVAWVRDMLENGRATYPPLNWNGKGDHTTDNAYAFDEGGDFPDPRPNNPGPPLPGNQTCDAAPPPPPPISVNALSQIVIIGDSLSDQQNQWQKTIANGDASFYTPSPGNGYWNGRFTNGYNWVDYLGQDYPGVKIVNLAVGGAFASDLGQSSLGSGLGAIEKKVRPTILQEYEDAASTFDRDTLAVIMIGGNDVYEVTKRLAATGTSPNNITADGLAAAIVAGVKGVVDNLKRQLVKRYIFAALPPIAVTPAGGAGKGSPSWGLGGDPAAIAFAQTVVGRANAGIRLIANSLNETGMYSAGYVDITSFLGSWQDPSGTFDLGAYPRPVENVDLFEMKEACADQDSFQISPFHGYTDKPCLGHMFFDNLHPTTLAHCLLSQFFEANGFSGAGIDDVHMPTGPGGAALSPSDLFLACASRSQNEAYSAPTWFTSPYTDPRHTRFYYQASGPMDGSNFPSICPNTCPTGYLWDNAGTDLQESPTPYDEPGWYDIQAGFTSSGLVGYGNGALARGWIQPKSGWPSGMRGACRCAPISDAKGVTCDGGPCSSPSDIARVMNAGSCRKVMFWSGYNGSDFTLNVKNDASFLSKKVGAATLEDTLSTLKMPDFTKPEGQGEFQTALWTYASTLFAANACASPVYVAFGGTVRPDNVWRKTECPLAVDRMTTSATFYQVTNLPGDPTTVVNDNGVPCDLDCTTPQSGMKTSCAPMLNLPPPPPPPFEQ